MAEGAGRVLVTGAAGFVGRAVVAVLSREGVPVTAVVRRPASLPAPVRVCRLDDIGPDAQWAEALAGCEAVVHLAGRVHMMRDNAPDPLAAYRRVNTQGTLSLARQAAAAGVRRMVFVSSVKVNGEETGPHAAFSETDAPAPADPYGISKAEAESGLQALAAETGLEVVIVRPPLVYGPGVKANFLAMTRFLARGVPLPLGSVTRNRRSLVALDNLVDLMIRCLDHPAAANQVFLVADGEDLSTTELLRRTAMALGVRPRLIPVPVPVLMAGATLLGRRAVARRLLGSLRLDISKARRVLEWVPPVSVDEGLRRTVRHA